MNPVTWYKFQKPVKDTRIKCEVEDRTGTATVQVPVFLSVDLIVKWDGAQLDQPAGQHQELGRGVPSLGHWPGPCPMITRGVTHSTNI